MGFVYGIELGGHQFLFLFQWYSWGFFFFFWVYFFSQCPIKSERRTCIDGWWLIKIYLLSVYFWVDLMFFFLLLLLRNILSNYLFTEDRNIFVEWFGRANVAAGHPGVPGGTCGQLALFKYQRQQGEERMPVIYMLVNINLISYTKCILLKQIKIDFIIFLRQSNKYTGIPKCFSSIDSWQTHSTQLAHTVTQTIWNICKLCTHKLRTK